MKKSKLLLLGAVLASFTFNASALDDRFDATRYSNITYQVQATSSQGNRRLTNFTLSDGTNTGFYEPNFDNSTGKTIWKDLTNTTAANNILNTEVGKTISFSGITWTGEWEHLYLFIDYNNDIPQGGGFNENFNNTGKENIGSNIENWEESLHPSPEGELVTFTCYNINQGISSTEVWYNSNGLTPTPIGGNVHNPGISTTTIPEFTIPSWVQPGTYTALLKIVWSDKAQHPTITDTSSNDYIAKGGCGVLFYIVIEGSHNVTVATNDPSKGSVSLKVNGVAISETTTTVRTSQSVVAVATPEPDHYFYNWTDAVTGDVVSTENEYNIPLTGDVSLNANFLNQEEFDKLPDEPFDPSNFGNWNPVSGREGRMLKNFTLANVDENGGTSNPNTYQVNQTNSRTTSIYFDITSQTPLVTGPGKTIRFTDIDWNNAGWMHGYLFINYNKDQGFNSKLNNTGLSDAYKNQAYASNFDAKLKPSENGELVAFSSYELTGSDVESQQQYVKSDGTTSTGNAGIVPPDFTIPYNLPAGEYEALFKIDWSDITQHGHHEIETNGGCVVKFIIKVVDPLYITGHAETNTSYEDAAIITIDYNTTGVAEGDKLVAVATQTGAATVAAAPAFTTLANDANNVPAGVIIAHKASPDGTTLTFNLDKDQEQAKLLFEQPTWDAEGNKTDNFKANTQYTYNVVLQTVDAEGNVTGEGLPYSTLQFTTANEGSGTLGVEDVVEDDSNAPALYYNLQGIQVNQPAAGQIYIVRQGKSVQKVLVK